MTLTVTTATQSWQPLCRFKTAAIPATIKPWLLSSDSLTERLIAACGERPFNVQVLRQTYCIARLADAMTLGVQPGLRLLNREVFLCCDAVPWVYAHSLIPVTTLQGPLTRLKHHGNKSLGATLFADRSIRRARQSFLLTDTAALRTHAAIMPELVSGPVWARRQLFYSAQRPLLVAEYFLPTIQ